MLFRKTLRRLSIAAVLVLNLTGFGALAFQAAANADTAPIMTVISISRTAAQPNRISGVVYTDEVPPGGLLVLFVVKIAGVSGNNEFTSYEPIVNDTQFKYSFTTHDFSALPGPSKPLPKGRVTVTWYDQYFQFHGTWPPQDHGELTLNAVSSSVSTTTTTLPSGSGGGTSTVSGTSTNSKAIATKVTIAGKLHDRLIGMSPVGSIHETWRSGRLVKVTAATALPSVVPGVRAHIGTVTWLLTYSGKHWRGTLRVVDQLEHVVASFTPTTVRWNKTGLVTGVAARGSGKTSSSLSWRV